ncbi:LysR family transcriptional regulator [Rhizobium sp. YIM 134829]|uniref:LysR family transcriptional regulator n=1 Tax=Rhizobium sp. YIM 134829 TaxID=3390453 RepID=UPI00397BB70D
MTPRSPDFDLAGVDWSLIRAFVAVVRTGNLTRAAKILKTTQPTVGRQIRRLEELTGEVLFDRTIAGLRPTAEAAQLYERAEAVDRAVTQFVTALRGRPAGVSGTVRVTSSQIFGAHILPALIAPLLEAHPTLEIELLVSDAVDNLLRREADIAVRFAPPDQAELITRRLGSVSLGLYASRAYLDRTGRGVPRAAADLAGHRVVGEEEGSRAVAFGRQYGVAIRKADIGFRSASMPAQRAAILAGIGIGPMLVHLAEIEPSLVRILPDITVATLPLWLVAHDDLPRSARLRAVFDHLAAELKRVVD